MPLTAKEFLAKMAEEAKDPNYPQKLAADLCDARDINDPANPEGDDYYDKLGAELEAHPIGRRRPRGRA